MQSDHVADSEVAFHPGEFTVYLEKEALPYIDYLDVVLEDTYGEYSLLVQESII